MYKKKGHHVPSLANAPRLEASWAIEPNARVPRLAKRPVNRACRSVAGLASIAVTFFLLQVHKIDAAQEGTYWKGELEVVAVSYDKDASIRTYTYEVLQNDSGMVRHQLTHTTSTISEQGRGIEIIDYQQGNKSVFDAHGKVVIRVPLVFRSASSVQLEDREILGFKCRGLETRWVQRQNNYRRVRQAWTPKNDGFRDTLLEIDYAFDGSDRLVALTMRVIRSVRRSGPIPPELFTVPSDLRVIGIDVP